MKVQPSGIFVFMLNTYEHATTPTAEVVAQASHLIANRDQLEKLLTNLHEISTRDWGGMFLEVQNLPSFDEQKLIVDNLMDAHDFFTEFTHSYNKESGGVSK